MRKRTKAIVAITVSALCVLASVGAAYGSILSTEEQEAQMVIDADATPLDVEKGLSEIDLTSLKEIEVCGHDVDGNEAGVATSSGQGDCDSKASDSNAATAMVDDDNGDMASAQSPDSCTISILGNTISYVDSYNTASAPVSTAGLWAGCDSTTDGSWAYFVGHHPGVFNCVMDLQNGDAVQVCDSAGNMRTYHVISIYDIPDETQWEQIAADVESHGESITLQTCCGDHQHYRIVEAI